MKALGVRVLVSTGAGRPQFHAGNGGTNTAVKVRLRRGANALALPQDLWQVYLKSTRRAPQERCAVKVSP